jgi:putative DNA primase/helicase
MPDAIDQFAAVIAAHGLLPDRIEADGELHRCKVEGGKSGRLDGAYVFHLDGLPAGGFINWRDGLGWQTWCAKREIEMSRDERKAWQLHAMTMRVKRAQDEGRRHADAAQRAAQLLGRCKPATNDHPYLLRKAVGAYGLHQLRAQLVMSVRDATGALCSLQFISPEGDKRFLTGGRKRGCYFAIGRPERVLCLAEGYATAASVFEATGYATAVAFDAGNLEPVARALRTKFPHITIIICADDDSETPGNPGVSCALAAARAVRGRVAVPSFLGVAA